MELTFAVEGDNVSRAFRAFADPRALDRPLKQFGGYLRKRVQARFAAGGPGWPERKASTVAAALSETAIARTSDKMLLRKLRRTIARTLARKQSTTPANLGGRVRSLLRRVAQEKALTAIVAGLTPEDARAAKSLTKQREKQGVASRGVASKPLGRLASSIRASVAGGTLTLSSAVPWSEIHNEGGTAGHGAKIPARPFLFLEAVDVAALEWLLVDALGEGFVKVG